MRICIDISQAVYEGTGSGRYVIELVKNLLTIDPNNTYLLFGSAMRRSGDLKRIVDDFSSEYPDSHLETKILPFPPAFYELIWNRLNLLKLEVFTGEVDVVHSSDWTQPPTRSARTVTTVHDLMPFLYPDHFHSRIKQAHDMRWKWIKQNVDHVIVDASCTKKDVIQMFDLSEDKISVIPLGCDKRFFEIGQMNIHKEPLGREDILEKYGVRPESYILSVGTLEPRKNIKRLIEAHQKLSTDLREMYPLLVVGKKAWAGDLGDHQHVTFTGYVPDEDLPYLYGSAKCFVMPSLYEGFGLPVLEAMACGVPVIASETSSLPEIGGEEIHYIEDPERADSIRLILDHVLTSNKKELFEGIKNAYNRAKTFTWERTAKETLAVYNRLYDNRH